MAVNYTTVVSPDDGSKTGGLGNRNQSNLKAIFPSSPIYKPNEYTPTAAENVGIATLNGGGGPGDSVPDVGVANGVVDDGGYMYNQVDLRFAGRRSSGVDVFAHEHHEQRRPSRWQHRRWKRPPPCSGCIAHARGNLPREHDDRSVGSYAGRPRRW